MQVFFALVRAWLIGWGMLLSPLRMRALFSSIRTASTAPRYHGRAPTLLDTTEFPK